jgi:hypothetical protein|tara:strand:- start:451 stop:582 length:132 start_codon:yes stop_codon:yes gene_type:complete
MSEKKFTAWAIKERRDERRNKEPREPPQRPPWRLNIARRQRFN